MHYLSAIRPLVVLLLLTMLFPSAVLGENAESGDAPPDSLEKQYQQAKFFYNQLETNKSLGTYRGNWLKGVRNFRMIYLSSPKSDLAPACLFMLGKLHYRMFEQFRTGSDLHESISYYQDTATLFPQDRLADDSLFIIGTIFLDQHKDIKKAYAAFNSVVTHHPTGDMYDQAATRLKLLSKDYDMPLPQVMLGNQQMKNLTSVLPVKYWSSNDYTRVVIKASGPVTYTEQLLEKIGSQPRRLYVDFHQSYIEPKYRSPVPIEDGLLQRIRTGQFSSNTVRVVLDIESISNYRIFSLPDPFRVVIDVLGEDHTPLEQSSQASVPKNIKAPAPNQVPKQQLVVLRDSKKTKRSSLSAPSDKNSLQLAQKPLSLAQQLGLGVKTIVLDPGHGGKDPGAMAHNLKEKDIVLRVAQMLAPLLEEQTGCRVILTRDSDRFIPLEERTAIANTNGADLFISLHINAHSSAKIRGLETYFLNLSTNAEAMRVAARENATSTHQMSDLQDILSDIMQNSKINESSRLARHVHRSLVDGLSQQRQEPVKNLGVKQAPFYVLIGAEMPAILIEMAFISNPKDADNLQSDRFLHSVATEISNGIQGYINTNTASIQ